ncbi:hypothetical protein BP5796_06140 [Coleophoma crateriformis]|uniref:Major facilitator superfamily (MFS) profile domain-containing protein n=1 Tax=Coleophoma crateriformis TaxID=565419 RepID=A0A3D8RWB2_9HELO|nr:hypothetical protein BP5796_06140 [Coleophoma crateriformis]
MAMTDPEAGMKEEDLFDDDGTMRSDSGDEATKSSLDSNIVIFDSINDPLDPRNWPTHKKVTTTVLYGFTTAGATWASSVYSPATASIAQEFGVSAEVSTLGLTLFLFGFGIGPLLWAPCSEVYGRRLAVFIPYFISALFCFGVATGKDIQTVLICRFFLGFFSSAPVTNTGGVMRDLWTDAQRGAAILCYSMAVIGGPMFSPIAGAAIVHSYLGWRWTHYLTGIIMLAVLAIDVVLIDETYQKVVLVNKAKKLRKETGNWALHAKHEEDINFQDLVEKFLVKPFQLLRTPICFSMVLYASFVYGIVYLIFSAYDIEFAQVRGWSPVVASLPFIAIFVGCICGAVICYYNQGFYMRHLKANNGKSVPEARLPTMMIGGISLSAGLFIFAWTSNPKINPVAEIIASILLGMGFFGIFQGVTNYLVDTFGEFGASAVAANSLMRNVFAGSFPLFTTQMFNKLGVDWAVSLLGFVSVSMIPIPFFFYYFGKRIRAKGVLSCESP